MVEVGGYMRTRPVGVGVGDDRPSLGPSHAADSTGLQGHQANPRMSDFATNENRCWPMQQRSTMANSG